jgi:choline dehydrogenase-like flavoprotein
MDVQRSDILIVGAGASGGVAARELAAHGLSVTCLEQGDWPDRGRFPGPRPDRDLASNPRWNANPNVRLTEADYPVEISESDVDISMYNAVGGSTVLWTAIWHRMLPSDFNVQTLDKIARDWPIDYADLNPFYDEIEDALGVSGLAGDPAYPDRKPYPLPPFPIGTLGTQFAHGMNRLGWHWWPGVNAIPSRAYRNLNACVRRGTCITGCADGAKASTDLTHWPDAIENGVTLITGARVCEITLDVQGRASGAIYVDRSGERIHHEADTVLLCANGIGTARLLLLSKSERFPDGLANSSGLVGRGLMLHPTALALGIVDGPRQPTWVGPMGQTITSMQFYESDASRGFVRGSKWSFAPSGGPLDVAMGLPGVGEGFMQALDSTYGHMMTLAIFGEDLPDDDNRVTLDDELTDSDGLPAPRIRYRVGANTEKLIAFNLARASEALREAGAIHTVEVPIQRSFGGAHLMGTARMGTDPAESVIDPWGQCHDVPGLYILDGSVFVTAGAVNPTATIMALALRSARHIASDYSKARGGDQSNVSTPGKVVEHDRAQ